MSSVLTVAEAKASIPGLSIADSAIQAAIDDIEAEIVDRFGAYGGGSVTEHFGRREPGDGLRKLVLRRKPVSITSVVEALGTSTSRTLSTNDYRLVGYVLERLVSGDHLGYRWSHYGVDVTYVAADDTVRRKGATIDVLKLAVGFTGVAGSIRIGDYAATSGAGNGKPADAVTSERSRILRRLRPGRSVCW